MKKLLSIIAISSLILLISGCGSSEAENTETSTEAPEKTTEETTSNQKIMQTDKPEQGEEIAVLTTSKGDVKIRLFPEVAPETVKNFKELTKQEKYVDVPIHRVINNFMIQMGDFENGNGTGGYSYKGPGTTIPDEPSSKLKHIYGSVSMAKTAAPNTGGSQFFIVDNQDGTAWLDGVHTVFGQVIEGMDIVEEISEVETLPGDKPAEEMLMKSVKLMEYAG